MPEFARSSILNLRSTLFCCHIVLQWIFSVKGRIPCIQKSVPRKRRKCLHWKHLEILADSGYQKLELVKFTNANNNATFSYAPCIHMPWVLFLKMETAWWYALRYAVKSHSTSIQLYRFTYDSNGEVPYLLVVVVVGGCVGGVATLSVSHTLMCGAGITFSSPIKYTRVSTR